MKGMRAILLALALVAAGCVDLAALQGRGGGAGTPAGADAEGPNENEAGNPLPTAGRIQARVINQSDLWADVTMRFVLEDIIVHLTFVRVPARTSTVFIGPDLAESLQITALDETNERLPGATYVYGVDFEEGGEAVYIIEGDGTSDNVPPVLAFVEPAADVTVAQGGGLAVIIDDEDPDSAAVIDFFLEPAEGDGDSIILATGVPEDPDGDDDSFLFTIGQDVTPGDYRLVGAISDELSTAIEPADGIVHVIAGDGGGADDGNDNIDDEEDNNTPEDNEPNDEDQGNDNVLEPEENTGPTLAILEPKTNVSVRLGEDLSVSWEDADEDDDALITLLLDPDAVDLDGGEIWIAEFQEDPDGPDSDSASITIENVEPGVYHLLGVISDGELADTDRAAGLITVLPAAGGGGGGGGTGGGGDVEPPPQCGDFDYDDDGDVDLQDYAEFQVCFGGGGDQELCVCDFDANTNGAVDGADYAGFYLAMHPEPIVDCQSNGIPDDQELEANDCNSNGVPDECDTDCNTNAVPDDCDIAAGSSLDGNTNGIPDECEQACCFGDGGCSDLDPDSCTAAEGTPMGTETDCGTFECPLPLRVEATVSAPEEQTMAAASLSPAVSTAEPSLVGP